MGIVSFCLSLDFHHRVWILKRLSNRKPYESHDLHGIPSYFAHSWSYIVIPSSLSIIRLRNLNFHTNVFAQSVVFSFNGSCVYEFTFRVVTTSWITERPLNTYLDCLTSLTYAFSLTAFVSRMGILCWYPSSLTIRILTYLTDLLRPCLPARVCLTSLCPMAPKFKPF